MKRSAQSPSRQSWTAQDLANAMSVRLSALPAFSTAAGGPSDNDSRYDAPPKRELRGRYLAQLRSVNLFHVHG
jgi:hypothetical protein